MTKKTENKTHVFLIVAIPGGAYQTEFSLFPNSCILEMYRKNNKKKGIRKMKTKKEPKTKALELEVIDDIFMVEKSSRKLIGLRR